MSSKKVYFIFFFSIAFLSVSIWYRYNYSWKGHDDLNKTEIYVRTPNINIGRVSDINLAFGEFYIKNIGNNSLFISNVKVSCTCSSVTLLDQEVQPGDSLLILVKYNMNTPSYFYSDVIVSGNFKNSPIFLSFEGNYVK
jgi:hypothetical protein